MSVISVAVWGNQSHVPVTEFHNVLGCDQNVVCPFYTKIIILLITLQAMNKSWYKIDSFHYVLIMSYKIHVQLNANRLQMNAFYYLGLIFSW